MRRGVEKRVEQVVQDAKALLHTPFGLAFLASHYEVAAKSEQNVIQADFAKEVAKALRS